MKTLQYILFLTLLMSCVTASISQVNSLDKIFGDNLTAFERVAQGVTSRQQLSPQQTAFLYLIADWSSRPTQFDHYKDLTFTKDDVKFWRKWYSTKKQSLDLDVVQKAIMLQTKFFSEGLLPESDIEFLEQTSVGMRAL